MKLILVVSFLRLLLRSRPIYFTGISFPNYKVHSKKVYTESTQRGVSGLAARPAPLSFHADPYRGGDCQTRQEWRVRTPVNVEYVKGPVDPVSRRITNLFCSTEHTSEDPGCRCHSGLFSSPSRLGSQYHTVCTCAL